MRINSDLSKNLFSSLFPQLVNIISNLILPTMIIVVYGSQINGLISTVRSIVSYIALIGAGISAAVTQSLYLPVAKGDINIVKGMLKAADNLFNKCGRSYLIIVCVVSFIYPLLVEGKVHYITMVLLLLVMSISGASEFFVVGRCHSLLYAHQKVYVYSIIQAFSLLVSLILAILMLKLNVDIVLVQFSISFVYILRAFILHNYIKRVFPQYNGFQKVKPIKKAIEKRNDAMIHQLSGLAVTGSQTIILSVFVSLEAASIYAIYNIVFSGLYSICSNINVAITPFLGKTYAVESKVSLNEKFKLTEVSFYLLIFLLYGVTSVMLLPFIELYTKDADINYVYYKFGFIFLIVQLFTIYRIPSAAIINVAGHYKETKFRAIIEASICVTASLLFTIYFGMYGVLLGTGCAIFWRCIDMIVYSHTRILFFKYYKSIFRLCRLVIIVSLFFYFGQYLDLNIINYRYWFFVSLIVALVIFVVAIIDILIFERNFLKILAKRLK